MKLTSSEYTLMLNGLASAADYHQVQAKAARPKATAGKSTDSTWKAIAATEDAWHSACHTALTLLRIHQVRLLNLPDKP